MTDKTQPEKMKTTDKQSEICNRTSCKKEGATWWNISTRAWYCQKCAEDINEGKYPWVCVPLTSLPPMPPPVTDDAKKAALAAWLRLGDHLFRKLPMISADDYMLIERALKSLTAPDAGEKS